MNRLIYFTVAIFLCVVLSFSEQITLQNGLNNYNGCEDIHIANERCAIFIPTSNDGTSKQLAIADFTC